MSKPVVGAWWSVVSLDSPTVILGVLAKDLFGPSQIEILREYAQDDGLAISARAR